MIYSTIISDQLNTTWRSKDHYIAFVKIKK